MKFLLALFVVGTLFTAIFTATKDFPPVAFAEGLALTFPIVVIMRRSPYTDAWNGFSFVLGLVIALPISSMGLTGEWRILGAMLLGSIVIGLVIRHICKRRKW